MRIWAFMLLITLGLSCSKGTTLDETTKDYPANFNLTDPAAAKNLLGAQRVVSLTQSEITGIFASKGLPAKAANGVHIYQIAFASTDLNGESITESGIVMVPDSDGIKPVTTLFHGTTVGKAGAPTSNPSSEGVLEASQGFFVIIPDYQGYGENSSKIHPYLIADSYVTSGMNAIRAGREFAEFNKIELMPALFLQGYSEGGYGAMALQKAIETSDDISLKTEFPLLSVAVGAGPYWLSNLSIASLAADMVNPIYVGFLTYAYEFWAGLDSLSDLLIPEDTEQLFLGAYSNTQVASILYEKTENQTAKLVESGFRQKFVTQQDESGLLAEIVKNTLVDETWVPQTKTYLFHCQGDLIVPPQLTRATYDKFKAIDASANVEIDDQGVASDPDNAHTTCSLYFEPVKKFGAILQSLSASTEN